MKAEVFQIWQMFQTNGLWYGSEQWAFYFNAFKIRVQTEYTLFDFKAATSTATAINIEVLSEDV